jgi:hypothetical protein
MNRGDLEAIDARISTLVEENAPALAKLRTLKRERRALSAGYASGDERRARVIERDEKICRAYQEAERRYGAILALAKQYKLSVRQVRRIIDNGAVRQADRDARAGFLPPADAAWPSEASVTKP